MDKKKKKFHKGPRKPSRRDAEEVEITQLRRLIEEGAPEPGSNPLAQGPEPKVPNGKKNKRDQTESYSYSGVRKFDALPLSSLTKDALKQYKFVNMTAIQRATLPHAICGRDVLGGAKTGSGKTLSFLIPLLELLYKERWTPEDGLGALVISPTRELALQIFDELRKVGRFHAFSAGLLIGGKDVKAEKNHIHGMNILVCTPGRLLQHMDETPYFSCSELRMLVLDEADRILDMGFAAALEGILQNLPSERQTLLFSATLTKSVKDLARLSLDDPEYLSVHSEAQAATPHKLEQFYSVVELGQKLDVLHSFIKSHLQKKMLVFFSSCKQVKFCFEALRKLRPGVPLKCLHGKMKQIARMAAYYEFCESKAMVLFATDIAARGLDIPEVDWVVQVDCPENSATYIHRVGRTARLTASGRAFTMLLPSEEAGMLKVFEAASIPVRKLQLNPKQQARSLTPNLRGLLSQDVTLKEAAQKAVVSYMRSVFLQPNKEVFDAHSLPVKELAESLGLPSVPRLRFLQASAPPAPTHLPSGPLPQEHTQGQGQDTGVAKTRQQTLSDDDDDDEEQEDKDDEGEHGEEEEDDEDEDEDKDKDEAPRRKERSDSQDNKKRKVDRLVADEEDEDDDADGDDDFLVVRRTLDCEGPGEEVGSVQQGDTFEEEYSRHVKKKKKLKIRASGAAKGSEQKRVIFNEEGVASTPMEALGVRGALQVGDGEEALKEAASQRFERVREDMKIRDKADRQREKEKRRLAKQEKKQKLRARQGGVDEETVVYLRKSDDDHSDNDGSDMPNVQREASPVYDEDRKLFDNHTLSREVSHHGMKQVENAQLSKPNVQSMEAAALSMIRNRT